MFNNSVSRSGRSLLEDEELTVPVPTEATPLAQAQRTMARWSNGPDHKVRRALAERDLSSLDNVALRGRAHALATQELLTATDLGEVARFVPVAVLAETLGFNHPQLAAHHQRVVSMAIAPEAGTPQTDEDAVNHSLNWLVVASGVTRFETAINRIALLHQCLDATAGLIALAALHLATRGQLRDAPEPDPAKSLIAWTIRNDPPVTQTIRVLLDGERIVVPLCQTPTEPPLTFGAGQHACPGMSAAIALATGVIHAVLDVDAIQRLAVPDEVEFERRSNLRIPRLPLTYGGSDTHPQLRVAKPADRECGLRVNRFEEL